MIGFKQKVTEGLASAVANADESYALKIKWDIRASAVGGPSALAAPQHQQRREKRPHLDTNSGVKMVGRYE